MDYKLIYIRESLYDDLFIGLFPPSKAPKINEFIKEPFLFIEGKTHCLISELNKRNNYVFGDEHIIYKKRLETNLSEDYRFLTKREAEKYFDVNKKTERTIKSFLHSKIKDLEFYEKISMGHARTTPAAFVIGDDAIPNDNENRNIQYIDPAVNGWPEQAQVPRPQMVDVRGNIVEPLNNEINIGEARNLAQRMIDERRRLDRRRRRGGDINRPEPLEF